MKTLISLSALFLSVILLQLSSGSLGPLDALSGSELNFSASQIGLLGSSHFLGFFIGCLWAPRLTGVVGHSRAFTTFTAMGAIGALLHTMSENPYAWMTMRIASGVCIAGCYTVIEAWLNAKVTNETRGRTMGAYRVADMSASLCSQLMISYLSPAHYVSYNILAMLCCLALLPLALTTSRPPEIVRAPRLRPLLAVRCSPLAVAAVLSAALPSAAFRMAGPVFGERIGLTQGEIAGFLAVFVLGGLLSQIPAGWLADKYDRRHVMIGLSAATVGTGMAMTAAAGLDPQTVMAAAFLFGLTSFPIYSVAAAHANDFVDGDQRVELTASLIFFYAIGAIAAPLASTVLIEAFGPPAMFVMISVAHVALIAFGVLRMRARPSPERRTRYTWLPRTTFVVGRLIGRGRERA